MVGRVGFGPTRFWNSPKSLSDFERFLSVDLQLGPLTVAAHRRKIKRFVDWLGKSPLDLSVEDIRRYLEFEKERAAPKHYVNILSALRRFYRDFLRRPDLVESFVFPQIPLKLVQVPTIEELRKFFVVLKDDKWRSLFLLFASSGLRFCELLGLRKSDIDLKTRKIVPQSHKTGRTKNSPYFTFFNQEASEHLARYLSNRRDDDPRLFKICIPAFRRGWKRAVRRSGVEVYPQGLRRWFCQTLTDKAVNDRYIDFLVGRSPRSILARHYSDFSVDRLKEAYDKANLRVLD
jgi:integrase